MARRPSTGKVVGGNRVQAVQEWLRRRADTPVGRLSLQWFRAYFAASRNSGCAITIYSSLSVLPMALIIVAVLYAPGGDTNTFAQHLVDHLNLTGATAKVVEDTFGSASSNALAASVATAVSFLIWGIGIGQLYQDVYARAWGVTVRSQAADQGRYAIFFFVFSGALALSTVGQAELGDTGRRLLFTPLWLLGSCLFWIAVPLFLLHGQVGPRGLLPGALLALVVLGGAAAFSPLFLPATMNANAKAFGSFGVVLTLIGWLFVLITLSLVCAVFAPVWADWRRLERERRARPPRGRRRSPPRGDGAPPRLRFDRLSGRPAVAAYPDEEDDMCRWLAYSGKSVRIEELLYRPRHSLIVQSLSSTMGAEPTNGDGFGIGWYGHGDEPGIFHSIEPAWNDRNLHEISKHMESPLVFAHVRASTGSPVQQTNCHPFRYKNWLFMHNGVIHDFAEVKRDLVLEIAPGSIRTSRGRPTPRCSSTSP